MKIVVNSTVLANELACLQRIVSRRSAIPALASVRLTKHDEGVVKATATDLDVVVTTLFDVDQVTDGEMLAPGVRLFELAKSIAGEMSIELKDQKVHVKGGEFESRLQSFKVEDYPTIETLDEWQGAAELRTEVLRRALSRTKFCVGDDSGRYFMNGIRVEVGNGLLRLVSTDGKRLSSTDTNIAESVPVLDPIVIPSVAIAELVTLLEEGQEDTYYMPTMNRTFFKSGKRTLTVRTVDAQFPAYDKVIPEKQERKAIVDRAMMVQTLRRVALVSDVDKRGLRLVFHDNVLSVDTASQRIGDAVDRMKVKYDGERMQIGLDPKYVLDFMAVAGSTEVSIGMNDENSAAMFEPQLGSTPANDGYKYVVMPIKLDTNTDATKDSETQSEG